MKLWQKINTLTGGSTKSRLLVTFLNEAAIWLVNSLPEKFLWSIATETTVKGWDSDAADGANINEGSSVAYDKILAVYRNDGSANGEVIRRMCREVPDKLIYAFDESNSIYHPTKMFPKFYKLSGKIYIKPTPDFNDRTTDGSPPDLTYTKPGASSTTSVASQAGDKGVIVYAAPPVVDENTESWVLVEWENVVITYAGALDMLRQSSAHQTSASTELSTVDSLLSTYNSAVPSVALISAPSLPSYALVGSMPTISITDYVDEAIQALPTLDTIETLSLPSVPSAVLSYSAPSGYTLPPALENVNDSLPTFVPPVMSAPKFSDADSHLSAEDPELAQARTAIIAQQVNEYNASLQGAVQDFNTNLGKFTADVNKATQDAQTEIGSYAAEQRDQVQEFQKEVEQYRNDVQKYTAEVGAKVQEFQQKEQAKTGRYNAEVKAFIGHFNAKMGQALQKYQQRAASEISRFQQEIAKYVQENQTGISKYQQDVAKDIQKYTAEIQGNRAEFQSKMETAKKSLEQAQIRLQTSAQYQQKSQDKFQKYNSLYRAALQELTSVTGAQAAPPQQQAEQRGEEAIST